jgi:hypothetical protein
LLDRREHEESERDPVNKRGRCWVFPRESPSKTNDNYAEKQNRRSLRPSSSVVGNRRRRVRSEYKYAQAPVQTSDAGPLDAHRLAVRNRMTAERQTMPQETKGSLLT